MNTQPQPIFQSIFRYVRTTHDAEELIGHIDTLLSHLYTIRKDSFDKLTFSVLDQWVAKAAVEVFATLHFNWNNPDDVKTFFTKLKEELQACEVLTLTLSHRPTPDEIDGYTSWARSNVHQNIIFEINVDQNLLGGAVIVYKGHYLDLSLRKQLDAYFQKYGEEILQNLKSSNFNNESKLSP